MMFWIYILPCLLQTCWSQTTEPPTIPPVCLHSDCSPTTGSCRPDGHGSYICICKAGFKGSSCHDDLDECARGNPCRHRGNCVNTPGSYKCACLPGWTGPHCHTNDTSYTGSRGCSAGWEGNVCDIDINECQISFPCMNNATCVNSKGSYTCACIQGFQGYTCQDDVNECLSYPCQNGGTCTNAIGSYKCACAPSFTGSYCEVQIGQNGGSLNLVIILGPSLGCVMLVLGIVSGIFIYKHLRKKRMVEDGEPCETIIEVDQHASTSTSAPGTVSTSNGGDIVTKLPGKDAGSPGDMLPGDQPPPYTEKGGENGGAVKDLVMRTKFTLKKIFKKN